MFSYDAKKGHCPNLVFITDNKHRFVVKLSKKKVPFPKLVVIWKNFLKIVLSSDRLRISLYCLLSLNVGKLRMFIRF